MAKQQQDWEDLARQDPLWAIYSDPRRRFGRWDLDEFLATGERDIAELMEQAARLGHPARRERALDFGCGVGRLTRALSKHFEVSVGVDISETMVATARQMNADAPGCEFLVNTAPDLRCFPEDSFDLVYSKWVLQHLPTPDHIDGYLREFVRVLRPGGLVVFQLRTRLSFRARLQLGRKLYALLRAVGVSDRVLYQSLKLNPIRVITRSPSAIEALLEGCGAEVIDRKTYEVPSGGGIAFSVTKPNPSVISPP